MKALLTAGKLLASARYRFFVAFFLLSHLSTRSLFSRCPVSIPPSHAGIQVLDQDVADILFTQSPLSFTINLTRYLVQVSPLLPQRFLRSLPATFTQ